MGTGAKVAIGCGCVVLLGTVAIVGVLGVGAWWAKGKIEDASVGLASMTAQSEEIDRFAKQANATPYTAPADGVVREARLLKFLETRKQVHAVYERHETELGDLRRKSSSATDKLSLSELWSAGGSLATLASEIRLAQMKALAGAGMSESEYRDIQLAVYKSAWAPEAGSGSEALPAEAGDALHVPRANVELFRKHRAEIQKYAMNGLAFIGL